MEKYFVILPKSAQKQILTNKILVVQLPTTLCICYELEISREKFLWLRSDQQNLQP